MIFPTSDISAVAETLADSFQWCVLRTRHQHEDVVARLLAAMGTPFYLPVEQVTQFRGKRQVVVTRPLFPAYLFAAYETEPARRDIRMIDDVAELHVETGRRQERLAKQIYDLRLTLKAHPDAEVSSDYHAGDKVRVTRGPMMNVEGLVIRRERRVNGEVVTRDVLFIAIDFFGRGVELDIDTTLCERI
jgi:transcription antitermination factor NusG